MICNPRLDTLALSRSGFPSCYIQTSVIATLEAAKRLVLDEVNGLRSRSGFDVFSRLH